MRLFQVKGIENLARNLFYELILKIALHLDSIFLRRFKNMARD